MGRGIKSTRNVDNKVKPVAEKNDRKNPTSFLHSIFPKWLPSLDSPDRV
jgi:hypothetical protein